MKKILLITTLFSCHLSLLKAAEAAPQENMEELDGRALKEIDGLESELKELETARATLTAYVERLGLKNTKLNEALDGLNAKRAIAMEQNAELALNLIEFDRAAPLEKLFAVAKSTNTLHQCAARIHPWHDNKIALLPFAAYTVFLNKKNCIPILKILKRYGVDLTAPVIISGEGNSRIDLTNARNIAREQNQTVFKFLLSQRGRWSLEKAKKIIEPAQPQEDHPERDSAAAADDDDDESHRTVLEDMIAKVKLDAKTDE